MKLSELWDWRGESGRGSYLAWGVILFAVKHNLDRVVAALFHRPWEWWSYLGAAHTDIAHLPPQDWDFYGTMAAVALPFIFMGVVLTLRRLRSAGWPLWLAGLFFVPLVNYLFFLVMAAAPPRTAPERARAQTWLARVIPESAAGSAAFSLLVSIPVAVAATLLAVGLFKDYGWGVFMGLPFWIGLIAALLHGYRAPRSLAQCFGVAALAITFVGGALFVIAAEGLVCLLMAAPLAYPLALLGAGAGYLFQRRSWHYPPEVVFPALLLALPGMMAVEHARPVEPPLLHVTTVVEIDAPPETVWRNVVSFQQIEPPKEWYFHTGLAYPIRAEIAGTGVGAERHCVFSTGAFVEPITVWDEPRLLKFGVTAEPPPMQELSPYPDIHPPHLDHYFSSKQGQFLLVALPGGRTRLEGTTWYKNRFWPQAYWQAWSDGIIHRIHLRVLEHVKQRSEADARR